MPRTIRNKFAKSCSTCGKRVDIGQGYAHQPDGGVWATYCEDHLPIKKPEISTKRVLTADGMCITPFEPENLGLLRAFPGAKFSKEPVPHWRVSLAAGDRVRVLEIAKELRLDIAPELLTVNLSEEAVQARDAVVNYMGHERKLYPYQVEGVDWLSKGVQRLLADDMGLGKTVMVLKALPFDKGAIAVVPASVKYNWQEEAKIWRPDLKVIVLEGRGAWHWPVPGELVLTNGDILPDRFKSVSPNPKQKWIKETPGFDAADLESAKGCVLVCDEGHRFSNPKAGKTAKVNGLALRCAAVWALTGTPLKNRPNGLYSMLETFGMAYTVFRGPTNFRKLYNASYDRFGGVQWGDVDPCVPALLRKVMLRRTKAEVLPQLPKKVRRDLKVNISKGLAKKCDALWDKWEGQILAELKSDKPKLPPFDQFSAIRAELAAERIDATLEYVENCEEQDVPLVVFAAHLSILDKLGEREGWGKITGATPPQKRTEVVAAFQRGELKGVACSILAAGIGITLTRASVMLMADMEWNPADNWQAEDRCVRIGQVADSVQIDRFVSDHPLDIHILRLNDWKAKMIEDSVENDLKLGGIPDIKAADAETEAEFTARLALVQTAVDDKAAITAELLAEISRWCESVPVVSVYADIPF